VQTFFKILQGEKGKIVVYEVEILKLLILYGVQFKLYFLWGEN
jgi:hypothetical protein